MNNLHINQPKVLGTRYKVLLKRRRKFEPESFKSWQKAFKWATENMGNNFRVFRRETFEWYEPNNEEIINVGKIKKFKEKK